MSALWEWSISDADMKEIDTIFARHGGGHHHARCLAGDYLGLSSQYCVSR